MASAACEISWIIYLLRDLGVSHSYPAILLCDNQAALHSALNPIFHEQTKHIELDCHFFIEKLRSTLLCTKYLLTTHC